MEGVDITNIFVGYSSIKVHTLGTQSAQRKFAKARHKNLRKLADMKIAVSTLGLHIGQVRLMEYFAGIFCMQIIPPKTEYFAKQSSVKWNYFLQIIPFWVE